MVMVYCYLYCQEYISPKASEDTKSMNDNNNNNNNNNNKQQNNNNNNKLYFLAKANANCFCTTMVRECVNISKSPISVKQTLVCKWMYVDKEGYQRGRHWQEYGLGMVEHVPKVLEQKRRLGRRDPFASRHVQTFHFLCTDARRHTDAHTQMKTYACRHTHADKHRCTQFLQLYSMSKLLYSTSRKSLNKIRVWT